MAESQKFIERNRTPRVQIAYDIETYGQQKRVELPFIVGVMADLSGKPEEPLADLRDRQFAEIDIDNFDEVLKKAKPRAAFQTPNSLTGQGNLNVDISFEKLEDFSPAAVAAKIEPLRKLFEARRQLDNLLTYVDGRDAAETLLAEILQDENLLKSLTAAPQSGESSKNQ